jgi:hypothetical protein
MISSVSLSLIGGDIPMMRSLRLTQKGARCIVRAFAFCICVLFMCGTIQAASPVLFYGVSKAQRYAQTNSNPPALQSLAGYRGEAFIFSTSAVNASVRNPINVARTLTNWDGHLVVSQVFDSWSPLVSAWPNGNYSLEITNAADGAKQSVMSLSGDFYPTPAHIQNFSDAQKIDAAQPFVLTWKPLIGSTADLVYLRIEDQTSKIFETSPIPGTTRALNYAATSVTIPANSLHEDSVYKCFLQVWRSIGKDTFTLPGALGETAYVSETTFLLRTRFAVQDVFSYTIEKAASYEQTTASPPVFAQNAAEFSARVVADNTNSVLYASVLAPNGALCTLTGQPPSFSRTFSSAALLAGALPAGGFTVRLNTRNNGNQTNILSLSGDNYPGIPQIQNIDAAQFINPAVTFRVLWNIPTVSADDVIDLVIYEGDQVTFRTGPMSGSTTGTDIPASTIRPGQNYRGMLRAFRPVTADLFTYPLCAGYAGFSRKTSFPIQARTGPAPQPTILSELSGPNRFEFTFSSVRGQTYSIQAATNAWNWLPFQTLTASNQTMHVLVNSPSLPSSYYRVLVMQ